MGSLANSQTVETVIIGGGRLVYRSAISYNQDVGNI